MQGRYIIDVEMIMKTMNAETEDQNAMRFILKAYLLLHFQYGSGAAIVKGFRHFETRRNVRLNSYRIVISYPKEATTRPSATMSIITALTTSKRSNDFLPS